MSGLEAQTYTITTIAGNGFWLFAGNTGPAIDEVLSAPLATSVDDSGNIFITDWGSSRICKVNTQGIISTMAGNGVYGFSGNGGLATAAILNGPSGICVDLKGNVFFTDIGNERIRKIDPSGSISTIAGNGSYGYSGNGSQAINASFKDPTGITLDASGDIFIADVFNNVIRKITTTGNIYTVAGNGIAGFYGDGGQASLAELYYPTGLAIDDSGNIYIADEDNNRIRKVTTDGVINTIAGNGIGGYSGDGAPATLASLNFPGAVTIDNKMNVYIADSYNNRIRMINSSGIISTIAGNGTKGYSGDDGLATAAQLYNPVGISLDTSGNIYISDSYNFRVRKLTKLTRGFSTANESVNIYPNPSHGIFNFKLLNALGNQQLEVFNILGQRVFICNLNPAGLTEINLSQESAGIYLYKITTDTGANIFRGRIVVL